MAQNDVVPEAGCGFALIRNNCHHGSITDRIDRLAKVCVFSTLTVPVGAQMKRAANPWIWFIKSESNVVTVTIIEGGGQSIPERMSK